MGVSEFQRIVHVRILALEEWLSSQLGVGNVRHLDGQQQRHKHKSVQAELSR